MRCYEIIKELEKIAPERYALSWDNVGLLAGSKDQEVKKVYIALDATDQVIKKAIEGNVDMLITHHPLIFSPLKKINTENFISKRIVKLIRNDISYYAMHTNFDVSIMGELAANYLELNEIETLDVTWKEEYYKLAVYVPRKEADIVRNSILEAGAGHIGNYSHCSFSIDGEGTFKPLEGTSPFIGEIGTAQKVDEIKMETIVPKGKLNQVINKMIEVHPYEEVAYDIYQLENSHNTEGIGKTGILKNEMTLLALGDLVKEKFRLDHVKVFGDLNSTVSKVAISPGSGKSMIEPAIKKGAQVLITGDIGHHEGIDGVAQNLCIIDAGHYGIESIFIPYIKEQLKSLNANIEIETADIENPFKII